MQHVEALAVPDLAAQHAVSRGKRTVMPADQLGQRPGLESTHARVDLVDRVPTESLLDPADRLEAWTRVALQRAADVVVVRERVKRPSRGRRLEQHTARPSGAGGGGGFAQPAREIRGA